MKKVLTVLLAALLLCGLSGCKDASAQIQNKDDGKLCIDEQRAIDFYLGNDEEGADPITAQCLAIIGDREPDSIETNLCAVDFNGPEDFFEIYIVNGVKITLLHYGEEPHRHTVLWTVDLDENHSLASGIGIGSTEEELKHAYNGKTEFYFEDHYGDDDTKYYALYGAWYERYPIVFEVDTATGIITDISYDLDV